MGQREWLKFEQKYPWMGWTCRWRKPGRGRWWKQALSKARRRYIKALLRGQDHPRQPTPYESECNWKNW